MSSNKDRTNCKSAQIYYYDLLEAETAENIPEEVRKHVASCEDCQSDINRLEELLASTDNKQDSEQNLRDKVIIDLLSLHLAWSDRPVGCRRVKPFLPSLADPILRITRQTPITKHIENCPACSEDLEELIRSDLSHRQLCRLSNIIAGDREIDNEDPEITEIMPYAQEIIERPDSRITTKFTLIQSENDTKTSGPSIITIKRLLKPFAAAAVILIGFAIFFNAPSVSAVGPDQIRMAIINAENVHVSRYIPGGTEPERVRWLSRKLNKYMLKVGPNFTLWDVSNNSKIIKASIDAEPQTAPFTKEGMDLAKKRLKNPTGIPLFDDNFNTREDAIWTTVPAGSIASGKQGCEVYDYIWSDIDSTNRLITRRLRVYVNPETNRPRILEYWIKLSDEGDFIRNIEYKFEYPSEEEIGSEIKKYFP